MKVNILQVLKNYEGKPIYDQRVKTDSEGKTIRDEDNNIVTEDKKLTLRDVITTALLKSEPNKVRTAEDKNKADQINRRIWEKNKKMIELSVKDAGYIIEKVGIFFNPLVLGRVDEILEGKGEEKEEKEKDA